MPSSNTVTLTSSLIQSITYIENSLVVTEGEDSTPPPKIEQDAAKWKITLAADRKGSGAVANSFNTRVGGSSHEYAPDGGGTGKMPDSLNFFFGVTITWNSGGTRVSTDVYLAQGSFNVTNNWWIGANAVVNVGTPSFVVLNGNVIVQILKMSGGTSSFTFSLP
jgi:hypothetical protein